MNKQQARDIVVENLKGVQEFVVHFEELSKMVEAGFSKNQISETFRSVDKTKVNEQLSPQEYKNMQSMYRKYSGKITPQQQGSWDQSLAGGQDAFTHMGSGPQNTNSGAFLQSVQATGKWWLYRSVATKITGQSEMSALNSAIARVLSQIPWSHWKLMFRQPELSCRIIMDALGNTLGTVAVLLLLSKITGGQFGGGVTGMLTANFINQRFLKDPLFSLTARGRQALCTVIHKAVVEAKNEGGAGTIAMTARDSLQRIPGVSRFFGNQSAANQGFTDRMRNFQEALNLLNTEQQKIVENFQKRMKARLKVAHRRILDSGRKDLLKVSSPFNTGRGKTSNAFLAKEGIKIKVPGVYDKTGQSWHQEENLEEMSAMAAGAVAFAPGQKNVEEEIVDE